MKKIYLPKLEKVIIENYSLYFQQPTFEFSFLDGISAIVGANGIGKTTFVSMIIYCLVGHKKLYNDKVRKNVKKKDVVFVDEDFFSSRMNEAFDIEKNKQAAVSLTYSIGNNNIAISRSLYENKIIRLIINEENLSDLSYENYETIITDISGISDFRDFEKIIRTFLFFDELRSNIAWDTDTQDEILRILLFDEEYFAKFKVLEEEVTSWDSRGRHRSEEKRMALETYNNLVEGRNKLLKEVPNSDKSQDKNTLLSKKKLLQDEQVQLQNDIEQKSQKVSEFQVQLSNLIGEKENVSLNIERLDEEISKFETMLYTSFYDSLPDYYYTIEHALASEGKCLVCGSKSKQIKELSVENINNGHCLVCSSKIKLQEEINPDYISKINELSKKRSDEIIVLQNKNSKIEEMNKLIEDCNSDINSMSRVIDAKKREIIYIESEIYKDNVDRPADTYTEILRATENKLAKLDEEIRFAYNMRDSKKNELLEYNSRFKKTITNLNKSLSAYFNKYASTFIGLECELTVSEKMINRIPHVIYLPKINGIIRKDIWAVSESQRFFLDQAFRMAIIDYLQSNVSGFSTFFITETPEGSLDVAYEAQVAEMFIRFAESYNNIIFTSNLNSSNFLSELFSKIRHYERKSRILNLLEKGNMTKVQRNNIKKLYDILKNVTGEDNNE